jgi:DNA-binding NarL/FixJ family response regulator
MIGGDDYITKPADLDELLARIMRASRRARGDRVGGGTSFASHPDVGTPSLTRRELEILGMVAHGQSPHEIASHLVISPKTVASHVQRVLGKLGVHSRTQAVARAHELGLVERRVR